jgi:hypothetical protein
MARLRVSRLHYLKGDAPWESPLRMKKAGISLPSNGEREACRLTSGQRI